MTTELMPTLATEIMQAHEAACRAAQSALEHARRAGELLIQAKAAVPHGAWLPWLAEHCPTLPERTARAYMRVARHWPALEAAVGDRQRVADLPLREALKLLAPPRESFNTGEHEWYSPPEYIEAARAVMGAIDVDPASSAAANAVVQASRYYDVDSNGLEQPWRGRLWLNPPYTNALMTAFSARLLEHCDRGDVTDAIFLTNNATDTGWFHALAAHATSICLPRGRAHYWRGDTQETSSALQGQAIFYFGAHADRFAEVFGPLGLIVGVIWRPVRIEALLCDARITELETAAP